MHWNEEYYLLGHDTHSPMPFLVPPSPGPNVSVGLFTEPCPFHLVPTPCYDILFYHKDVNRRHTPPETLRGISRGLVCLFQRNLLPSSLLGWLNHTDEGTMIIWNFKNYQTQWHRVISQDWIFSNTTMRTSILARCINTFLQKSVNFCHTMWHPTTENGNLTVTSRITSLLKSTNMLIIKY